MEEAENSVLKSFGLHIITIFEQVLYSATGSCKRWDTRFESSSVLVVGRCFSDLFLKVDLGPCHELEAGVGLLVECDGCAVVYVSVVWPAGLPASHRNSVDGCGSGASRIQWLFGGEKLS